MNKLDQSADQPLRAIEAHCPRLLCALQESPEAVWGEIMRTESACEAFKRVCSDLQDESPAVCEIINLVEDLRCQMAKDGLMNAEEFATFRQSVSDLQRCADRLRNSLSEKDPKTHRPLKTCVFYCSNNMDASRLAGILGEPGGDTIKTIGLPCSGKVDVPYLVKALETGADGAVIVACNKKECRHFEGSLRAHKRAEAVESLLEEIGFGAGRMAVIECAPGGAGQVCDEIRQFVERVRSMPLERSSGVALKQQERVAA